MPAIGVLTLEIHVEYSHSLKDKRHVVKSLKDRLRERFNVAVAESVGSIPGKTRSLLPLQSRTTACEPNRFYKLLRLTPPICLAAHLPTRASNGSSHL